MRLKTRLVKDPYRVKIMPPVQLVVMTAFWKSRFYLAIILYALPYFPIFAPFPLKNILWHDKQPFALHFTTCKWSNQSPQSSVEPFSRKGLTILPFSFFLPLDSQRSLPFPGLGKFVSPLELNCRTLSLQLNSLVCWRVSLGIPFCIAKHPVCFQYAILSNNWGAVHLGKVASTTFSRCKNGEADVPPPHGFAC